MTVHLRCGKQHCGVDTSHLAATKFCSRHPAIYPLLRACNVGDAGAKYEHELAAISAAAAASTARGTSSFTHPAFHHKKLSLDLPRPPPGARPPMDSMCEEEDCQAEGTRLLQRSITTALGGR
jgi:hypothetical protein